jgi:hypothetical protein
MFVVIRDIDPRRPELIVRRLDGSKWITTAEGEALVINSKAEARNLIETLLEITMTIDFNLEAEAEDA